MDEGPWTQGPELAVVLLTFSDQIVDEFLGASDRTITIAMRTHLPLGVADFDHPHPTGRRTRLYDLKLNTSILHASLQSLLKCQATYPATAMVQRNSLVRLDVHAKS
jgi:hypothetical protein